MIADQQPWLCGARMRYQRIERGDVEADLQQAWLRLALELPYVPIYGTPYFNTPLQENYICHLVP